MAAAQYTCPTCGRKSYSIAEIVYCKHPKHPKKRAVAAKQPVSKSGR